MKRPHASGHVRERAADAGHRVVDVAVFFDWSLSWVARPCARRIGPAVAATLCESSVRMVETVMTATPEVYSRVAVTDVRGPYHHAGYVV